MDRSTLLKALLGLAIIGTIAAGILMSSFSKPPVTASETLWPEQTVGRFHASCIKDLEGHVPAIQEVLCNCQVSEMKRWLQPSDMTVHFAAVDGRKGWTEVEEFTRDLSKPEQQEFLGRVNQFRESALPTCAKVGFNAGLTKEDFQ